MMARFVLQKSQMKSEHWVCTDTENNIVCVFKEHEFNDTQEVTMLDDIPTERYADVARWMREMGEWLRENHYDLIF